MSHLLDTNAWKALAIGTRFAPQAEVITKPETPLFLLDVSLWEIAKAVESGTFSMDRPVRQWIREALFENITVLPITADVAAMACELVQMEGFPHKDPTDQLVAAAARVHGLTLVTRDGLIRKWNKVKTLRY